MLTDGDELARPTCRVLMAWLGRVRLDHRHDAPRRAERRELPRRPTPRRGYHGRASRSARRRPRSRAVRARRSARRRERLAAHAADLGAPRETRELTNRTDHGLLPILLAMRAAGPATRPAFAASQLRPSYVDSMGSCIGLLRGLDPADPFVATKGRAALPGASHVNVRRERRSQIRGHAMHGSRRDGDRRLGRRGRRHSSALRRASDRSTYGHDRRQCQRSVHCAQGVPTMVSTPSRAVCARDRSDSYPSRSWRGRRCR